MIIGCLTYATTATHPDLAAAVGILSKSMSNPEKIIRQAVKEFCATFKGY